MPEHIALDKVESILHDLIEKLRDEQEGLRHVADRLVNDRAKRLLLEETLICAEYAGELENELHRLGVHDVKTTASAGRKIHRFWTDLKTKLQDGDYSKLSAAEEEEDEIKDAYAHAVKQELPLPLREILDRQQAHIVKFHNELKALRDLR
jgi:uncharacterized protein (TIGR02284 family)